MTDQEWLEKIKETYNKAHIDYFGDHEIVSVDKKDLDWLISTVEEQAEKIAKTETYLLDISSRMDDLHEYLRENHYGKGLGKHIVDVAIQVMEEQQKEIERLDNEMDGLLTIVEDRNPKAHDLFIKLKQENSKLRKALEGVLKYRHVDEGLKDQLRGVLKKEEMV